MWALYQILACIMVVSVNSVYRQFGLTWTIWAVSLIFVLPAQLFFGRSFETAPSFFQAWCLGNAVLAICGFVVSLLFFDGILVTRYYIGMALAIVAAYLLST